MIAIRFGLWFCVVGCVVEPISEAMDDHEDGVWDSVVDDSMIDPALPPQTPSDSNGLATRVVLDPEEYPLARCNDGTAPVYYYTCLLYTSDAADE